MCSLRKWLLYYQRLMAEAKAAGDMIAHEVYRQKTRQLTEKIRQQEKTGCSQQSAKNKNDLQLRYYWLQMNEAKKAGDEEAYSVYRDKYRELLIHKKSVC